MTCKLDNTGLQVSPKLLWKQNHKSNSTRCNQNLFYRSEKSFGRIRWASIIRQGGRLRPADILLSFPQVSTARCAIQVFQFGNAHNRNINGQIRRQSLPCGHPFKFLLRGQPEFQFPQKDRWAPAPLLLTPVSTIGPRWSPA